MRKNALQVLIPKFGLEGTIYLLGAKDTVHKSGIQFVFNEEVKLSTFFYFKFHSNGVCCFSLGSLAAIQRYTIPGL